MGGKPSCCSSSLMHLPAYHSLFIPKGEKMKWGEFVKRVVDAGVKDDDEIWFIDIAFDDEISIYKDPSCGWSIS